MESSADKFMASQILEQALFTFSEQEMSEVADPKGQKLFIITLLRFQSTIKFLENDFLYINEWLSEWKNGCEGN